MELTFALFALLPLGLFSLFTRARGAHAGIGFLALLAPVIVKGVMNLVKRRQAQNAEKRGVEFDRETAASEQAQARAAFEAQQNSPGAARQRLAFNTRLSRILGSFGGRDSTPEFITRALDLARGRQEFVPGAEFRAPPSQIAGGLGGFFNDAADAASQFDVQRFKAGRGGGGGDGGGGEAPAPAPTASAGGFKALLPSAIRGQDFKLGPAGEAEEDFLGQKRSVPARA